MEARTRIRLSATPALYLLTPPEISDLTGFATLLRRVLSAGSFALVQLRLKRGDEPASDETILSAANLLAPVIKEAGARFILNDSAELVEATGADGVHLGAEDMGCAEARALLGADKLIGVSCYDSLERAQEAEQAGADYVAFGAFFPTQTKIARSRVSPKILGEARRLVHLPLVAIGGISSANAADLFSAGADYLALSGAVWQGEDGAEAEAAALSSICVAASK